MQRVAASRPSAEQRQSTLVINQNLTFQTFFKKRSPLPCGPTFGALTPGVSFIAERHGPGGEERDQADVWGFHGTRHTLPELLGRAPAREPPKREWPPLRANGQYPTQSRACAGLAR